ncbi:MAG: hypothetical protein R8J85_01140 [Mariprofundales bacterium]
MNPDMFFESVTGKRIRDMETVMDAERVIEDKMGHPLPVCLYDSSMIQSRGNIFPVVERPDIDAEIDRALGLTR